jgi:hypothetical protein
VAFPNQPDDQINETDQSFSETCSTTGIPRITVTHLPTKHHLLPINSCGIKFVMNRPTGDS